MKRQTYGIPRYWIVATHAILFGLCAATSGGQEPSPETDDEGAQVLTRGPVHEAFAGIVSYNPEPGVIVAKAPPEAIEELPPEMRPAGDNISWIPGYWGWDDERSDYLWISGTWRELPPGRRWTTGYWGASGQGHQWISGYWADSSVQETTYLPRPPVTVEIGPNIEAPSRDHSWTPGSWMWSQERYAWRPGYWAEGRSNWDWIPAQYVWTPRGYVFVDGYWDYSFDRRGVLYAPVYFRSDYYSRPGYSYSPSIAIGLVAMMEHLFLRPNYHHYYFGDYYDRRYRDDGYYAPYAYQSSRYGYDPVYSYRRWTHRQDNDWERNFEESHDYRRDHEAARPPRTWADQKTLKLDVADSRQRLIATPFEEMAKREDSPMRVEKVSAKEREKLKDMSREVRKTRDERRVIETKDANTAGGKADTEIKPTKAKLPASPIVGKPSDRFSEKEAPPKPQRSPIVLPKKEAPDRNPTKEKTRPERREEPSAPRREEVPAPPKPQPRPEQRNEVPAQPKPKPQPERSEEKPTRQEPAPKPREPKRETREETRQPERKAPTQEESKPKESSKRERDTPKPPSGKPPEPEKKAPEPSEEKPQKKERK